MKNTNDDSLMTNMIPKVLLGKNVSWHSVFLEDKTKDDVTGLQNHLQQVKSFPEESGVAFRRTWSTILEDYLK